MKILNIKKGIIIAALFSGLAASQLTQSSSNLRCAESNTPNRPNTSNTNVDISTNGTNSTNFQDSRENCTLKFGYYQQAIPIKEEYVDSLYNSVARVRNTTKFSDSKGLEKLMEQEGCGIVLKGGYVLTAHHVVHNDVLREPVFGFVDKSAKKTSEENYVAVGNKKYSLEYVVEENTDYCFSLLKIKEKQNEVFQYPFKIGDSQKVKVNDLAIIIGNSANFGIFWRVANIGRVSLDHDYFNPTENVYPGDSGGGVFTIKDGTPELVGLILEIKGTGKYPVGIGFPMGINSIMKYIEKEKPELVKLWK